MMEINPAVIYENDQVMCQVFSDREWKNFKAKLRRCGFRLSLYKEAFYHPNHWALVYGDQGPGDTWIFDDAFIALTTEAKETLDADPSP